LDDSLGIVHCDDFFGTASEKFAKQTFACAQIGDDDRRNNAQQHLAECLPGTAGAVTAVKAASDLVEIKLRLLGTAREDALEVYLVGTVFGNFFGGAVGDLDEFADEIVGSWIELVEGAFAFAARLDHLRILQLLE